MQFAQRKVPSADQAISIAQKGLHRSIQLYKELKKVELDLEGIWKVEIELPLEGRLALIDIDSGTGDILKLEFTELLK